MKKKNKVATWFQPETRFEVTPLPAVPFRGTQETELDRLKNRLLQQLLDQTEDPQLYAPLRRAAKAWVTWSPTSRRPAKSLTS